MLAALVLAAVWWALFALSFRQDRRRVRNGALLLCALWSSLSLVMHVIGQWVPGGRLWTLATTLSVLPGLVALGGFLVANGTTILRKEGRTPGNALSLLAGLALFAAPVVSLALVLTLHPLGIGLGVLIGLVSLHLGVAFAIFLAASLLYQAFPRRLASSGIIVHGAGLIRGRVTPLLRSRLDAAVAVREELLAQGVDPLVVPSGGKGPDEPRSEGEAMAEYLVEQAGVPAERVLPETASRTTEENIVLSHRLLDETGRTGPYTVVTSRYHAFRAALLARSLGFEDEAIGGPTASYYVPSATLREFVAVMSYRRWWNLAALVPSVAATVLLTWALLAGS